jgi:hypothetical protein
LPTQEKKHFVLPLFLINNIKPLYQLENGYFSIIISHNQQQNEQILDQIGMDMIVDIPNDKQQVK